MQEVDSYIQEMHKQLTNFTNKKRQDEKEYVEKIDQACKDLEQMKEWQKHKSEDKFALILACITEKLQLDL